MTITHDRGTKHHHSNSLLVGLIAMAAITAGALGVHTVQQGKLQDIRDAQIDLQQACNIKLTSESITTNAARDAENATRALRAIPNLPGFGYPEAQTLLTKYAPCTERIQATQGLFEARSLTQRAATIDQTTVLPVEDWRAIQTNLTKAVQLLQAVPKDSPLAKQAKQELSTTRAKLAQVNQRLQQEEAATIAFNQAASLSQSAEQAARNTTNLDTLLKAQQNYVEAIQTLRRIPQNTTVYDRAQQNLSTYRAQLENVEIRYAQQVLKPILNDLVRFANTLIPSMGYSQYAQQLSDVNVRFENATRSGAITKHPSYAAIARAIDDYNNALTVWGYCQSGNCYNSLFALQPDLRRDAKWLPGDFTLRGKLLTEQYPDISVSRDFFGRQHLELNEILTRIWEHSDRHLRIAREQL